MSRPKVGSFYLVTTAKGSSFVAQSSLGGPFLMWVTGEKDIAAFLGTDKFVPLDQAVRAPEFLKDLIAAEDESAKRLADLSECIGKSNKLADALQNVLETLETIESRAFDPSSFWAIWTAAEANTEELKYRKAFDEAKKLMKGFEL